MLENALCRRPTEGGTSTPTAMAGPTAVHTLAIVRDTANAVEEQLLRAYELQLAGPIPMLNDVLRQFRAFQAFWAEMAGDTREAAQARRQARRSVSGNLILLQNG